MRKIKFFILIFLLVSFCSAATIEDIATETQRSIQQKAQLEEERNNLIRKQAEIEKIREAKLEEIKLQKEKLVPQEEIKILIKEIKVEGVTVFNQNKIRKITQEYINKNLSKTEIGNIQIRLQNLYMKKGYTVARVYLNFNEINEGILKFVVAEGIIEKIHFKDDEYNNISLFMPFPFLEKNVFNIRKIEQGLEQMNKLASNDAVMNIRPSEIEGQTIVEIVNKKTKMAQLSLSVDDSGTKDSSQYKETTGINLDNLFLLNENINFSYSYGLEDCDEFYTRNYIGSMNVPFGFWTIIMNYSESSYLRTIKTNNNNMEASGGSTTKALGLERMLVRGQTYRLSSGAKISQKDTESFYSGGNLDVSTRRIVPAEIYLSQTKYLSKGSLFMKATYFQGLDIWAAKKDLKNLAADKPKAQYEAMALTGYLFWRFNMPRTNLPLTHTFNFRAQYSRDVLFGPEQFGASPRGFKDGSISGEKGFNVSNEFKVSLSQLFPFPKELKNCSFGTFHDFAVIDSYSVGETQNISSWGFTLSANFWKYLDLNFSLSNPIKVPDQVKDEKNVVDVSLTMNVPLF